MHLNSWSHRHVNGIWHHPTHRKHGRFPDSPHDRNQELLFSLDLSISSSSYICTAIFSSSSLIFSVLTLGALTSSLTLVFFSPRDGISFGQSITHSFILTAVVRQVIFGPLSIVHAEVGQIRGFRGLNKKQLSVFPVGHNRSTFLLPVGSSRWLVKKEQGINFNLSAKHSKETGA